MVIIWYVYHRFYNNFPNHSHLVLIHISFRIFLSKYNKLPIGGAMNTA